ncbi:MAG: MCE family protein [Actinobacteria bacterium]|nr:MCE family protein [Actinomycetota bacterium]
MRRLAALAVLAVLALLAGTLAACGRGEGLLVTARFADVGDLTDQAPVMMADITVGKVTDIRLDGTEAVVTMVLDPEAGVPRDAGARIRRTSLLGERVVDLVIPEELAEDAPSIRDGDEIGDTDTRPDLEDLVREGADVFGAIGVSELATMIDEGARGFGEQGDELGALLGNLQVIVSRYAGRTDDIDALIRSMDRFNRTLATRADAHGLALRNSARGLRVLREESGRLQEALHSLARLARGADSILEEHSDEMDRFFSQIRTILRVLREEQDSIEKFLIYAPLHNRNTQLVDYGTFNQVIQDFVICGFNDDPEDPARRCKG